jgi:hypothetical protein
LKERCYERGAEDNLTVVLVRVGKRIAAHERMEELEPTITPDTQPVFAVPQDGNQTMLGAKPNGSFVPASRIAFPAPATESQPVVTQERLNVADPTTKKVDSGVGKFFGAILILILLAGAFLAGARYRDRIPFLAAQPKPEPTVAAAPKPVEEPFVRFERARREVDKDPRAWLASEPSKELLASGIQSPLDSPNPEFLYLYGRANLLSGNPDEAWRAFEAAISKTDAGAMPSYPFVKKEATLAMAAVSLKTQSSRQKALLHYDELTKPPANQTAP